jgi:hypothetical protein
MSCTAVLSFLYSLMRSHFSFLSLLSLSLNGNVSLQYFTICFTNSVFNFLNNSLCHYYTYICRLFYICRRFSVPSLHCSLLYLLQHGPLLPLLPYTVSPAPSRPAPFTPLPWYPPWYLPWPSRLLHPTGTSKPY